MNWNIVCPGISLKSLKQSDLKLGKTVAVNRAIFSGFDFDYFCINDEPEIYSHIRWLIETDRLSKDKGPILWFPKASESRAQEKWDWLRYECYDHELELYQKQMPYESVVDWTSKTMLIAAGNVIARGFKKITLYGADMIGRGHFNEGWVADGNEERWREEREELSLLVREARQNGIRVSRNKKT